MSFNTATACRDGDKPPFKKTRFKPRLKTQRRIPPEQNVAFVAAREDALSVYARSHDENRPVVCMDRKPYQLLSHAREPLPMESGKPAREDFEYARNGTCSIFIFAEPLSGWRHAEALPRRTQIDRARRIRWLLDGQYPEAEKNRACNGQPERTFALVALRGVSAGGGVPSCAAAGTEAHPRFGDDEFGACRMARSAQPVAERR